MAESYPESYRYEQFLLFQQCFPKACFPGASKGVIVWEWVNEIPLKPGIYTCNKNSMPIQCANSSTTKFYTGPDFAFADNKTNLAKN